jgi:hypothetical protein
MGLKPFRPSQIAQVSPATPAPEIIILLFFFMTDIDFPVDCNTELRNSLP